MPFKDTIIFSPKGKMNTDSDVKMIPRGDIVDSFCCRWGIKNDGTVGAVENIKGNELLGINLPLGNNKVIGGCPYHEDNSVLVFLFNDQIRHCILRIDMLVKSVTPILWEEPALELSDGFIQNPKVLDGVLYWLNTDGILKKLIIEKAKKLTYQKYGIGIGYWKLEEYIVYPNN
jgi:hypothetical protein